MRWLVVLSVIVSCDAYAETKTMSLEFNDCIARREQVISSLNVNPRDIIPVVNTGIMTMTRVCTVDGSVLVTCSKPDAKMVITTSPKQCR